MIFPARLATVRRGYFSFRRKVQEGIVIIPAKKATKIKALLPKNRQYKAKSRRKKKCAEYHFFLNFWYFSFKRKVQEGSCYTGKRSYKKSNKKSWIYTNRIKFDSKLQPAFDYRSKSLVVFETHHNKYHQTSGEPALRNIVSYPPAGIHLDGHLPILRK